ncbi:MAG: tellurite resistance protein [Proteobacteria bacterium]|nr:tellurite resistance protein [Pseudomonadota bacterium]
MTTASEEIEIKQIKQTIDQSQVPETLDVVEYEGQGALTVVQEPEHIIPVPPSHIDAARDQEIGRDAKQFAESIISDPSNYELGDRIFDLGSSARNLIDTQVSLFDTAIGVVLKDINDKGENTFQGNMMQLKMNIDQINPAMVAREECISEKVGRIFKKTIKRLPKGEEILTIIYERRETTRSTVLGLQNHLRRHGETVNMHAAELITICNTLKDSQPLLHEDIYWGQLAWKFIMERMDKITDPMARENITMLTADLATAVVDSQQLDNMNLQTRYGGGLTIRNARHVGRVIRSTSTLLGGVAGALAVRAAAAQQLQTMQVANMMQDAIGQTMVDTADQVGKAVVASAEQATRMDKNIAFLQEACNKYEFAAQALTQVCANTIKVASLSTNKLNEMNTLLRSRADAAAAFHGKQ